MNERATHPPAPPRATGGQFFRTSPRHLLGVQGMHPTRITPILDLADSYTLLNRSRKTPRDLLRGRTVINLFSRTAPAPARPLNWRASGWARMW